MKTNLAKILIVEDNQDIRFNIVDYLETKDFITDNVDDGLKALALLTLNKYDLVILDLMLPGLDGISLLKELRAQNNLVPVLILSARDTTQDRIEGLSVGADDYLVKPFSLAELKLRVEAILRRSTNVISTKVLHVEDLCLDLHSLEVKRQDTLVKLNPTTFKLLKFLMIKSPNIVTRKEIEYELWGDELPESDSLRTHLHFLRNAIDKNYDIPLLHTVKGFGWVLKKMDH